MNENPQIDDKNGMVPLVSVVIPCYNVEDYVVDALDSVAAQTYPNLEIICVDDGSSDGTFEVVEKWKQAYRDFKVILEKQKNSGACAARNNGLSHASGSMIQFLDADDVLYPEKIAHQVRVMSESESISFVAGSFSKLRINGESVKVEVDRSDLLGVFCGLAGITSSNLFRYNHLKEINGWNEQLRSSQEADLMFRLLMKTGASIADNVILTEVRERVSGQISQGNPVKRWRSYLQVRLEMINGIQQFRLEEWERNKNYYQSFMVSTLLVMNQYDQEVWKEFKQYLPKPSELVPIAGLSPKIIRMAQILGYKNLFRIKSVLGNKV